LTALGKNSNTLELGKSGQAEASSIAVYVALISWTMLFATLFMAYALYRANAKVWPPAGFGQISLLYPSLSSMVILLSSFALSIAKGELIRENLNGFKRWLYLTVVLGSAFLLLQTKLWSYLKMAGVYKHSGIFGSIIYGFTWIHFAHVVLGLLGLFWLRVVVKNNSNRTLENRYLWFQAISKFWHFLGVIWLLMYISIFVF